MTPARSAVLAYSCAHFAVDLGCAFAMFSACRGEPAAFLLYNFCAFAMQMPMGLAADLLGKNRLFALIGIALTAVMCLFPRFGIPGAVVLGLGNGLFHIGGGLDVLNLSGRKAGPLGVFVSPGALGLYCGTLLAGAGASPLAVLGILLQGASLVIVLCRPDRLPANAPAALPQRRILPGAVLLFLVVVLRSYGGLAAAFPWKTGFPAFLAVAAVVLGKTLGGFAADRFGSLPTAAVTLPVCAGLFFLSAHPAAGIAALLLFNMTMPITLFALARAMPGCKGFSFGLLTFALFLGYLPIWLGTGSIGGSAMAVIALASALLLLPGAALLRNKEG